MPVCVIYDAVGSIDADDAMFDEMRAAGCDVREFNPIAPWRRRFALGRVKNRDHRKILVVDQYVALTGGVNLGDPWAPIEEGGAGWRDDMIRIEGVAALSMRDVFLFTWSDLGGREPSPAMGEAELIESGISLPKSGSSVRVLANKYRRQRAAIRRGYLTEIGRAKQEILITNSYFVPDRVIRKALAAARRRGVAVKVLLPGESDVAAVYFAARRLYSWMLARGIELYEWNGTVLHAKTAVVDRRWCTVGTYNMDYLSWRNNLEVNVAVVDESLGGAMARRFGIDTARSTKIEPDDWGYRPLGERALEEFFYLFRRLL